MVCTQETVPGNSDNGGSDQMVAVAGDEEAHAEAVRQWYFSRLDAFRPMWLQKQSSAPALSPSEVMEAWKTYERVAHMLNCEYPRDRIRAVYPLMFSTPVDSHEGLVSLVDVVASGLEVACPGAPGCYTARQHYYEISYTAATDEDPSRRPPRPSSVFSYATIQAASTRVISAFKSAFNAVRSARSTFDEFRSERLPNRSYRQTSPGEM